MIIKPKFKNIKEFLLFADKCPICEKPPQIDFYHDLCESSSLRTDNEIITRIYGKNLLETESILDLKNKKLSLVDSAVIMLYCKNNDNNHDECEFSLRTESIKDSLEKISIQSFSFNIRKFEFYYTNDYNDGAIEIFHFNDTNLESKNLIKHKKFFNNKMTKEILYNIAEKSELLK